MIRTFLLTFVIMVLPASAMAVQTDEDSCWNAPNWCVTANSSWSQRSSDQLIVRYTNNCDARIYLRYCHTRNNGTKDCGATGIGAGRTHNTWTNNADGNYEWRFVGVTNPSKDWVCAGKVRGWRD